MAENGVSVIHRAFNNLLATLTTQQLQNFVNEMNAPNVGSANANTNTPNLSTINSVTPTAASLTAPTASNAMARTNNSRGKRSRENGKLRPLNSFIAFRSMLP